MVTSLEELIGNTPLMELRRFGAAVGARARIAGKLEMFNPAGSVKDRVARAKGYRVVLTMPESMSEERRKLLAAYGAELVLTPAAAGMQGAIDEAARLQKEIPGAIIAGQFENPANPRAHEAGTAPEIWRDCDGQVDIFVAGVGTGGTLTGVGRWLKAKKPSVELVAVEPADSPLLSGGQAGPHDLQGIGANFIPAVLDTTLYDRVIPVTTAQAFAAARMLAAEEGLLAGITAGAALHAAAQLARLPENEGKLIVALLPDGGEKYLSTGLFDPAEKAVRDDG